LADDWAALIKQVKEANDIVEVVSGYVALRPAGPTYKGLCPFHNDRRPSFDVDPRRQRYRCWSCGKFGDVLNFLQEHDKVDFREALELLARRAGIPLQKTPDSPQQRGRAAMLQVMKWAAEQYHQCLLDSPLAEDARRYLGERHLTGETARRFGLGYAPPAGDWLLGRASQGGLSVDTLEKVGLFAPRDGGQGHYDRFRERVIFPIRDARGNPVGLGGRILPSSPLASRAPKYYNSCDTPLFSKQEHLYGIDQARQAGFEAGHLIVVEGYTDVLMAHQLGIRNVVSTMGTALNARHVQHLRRWVPRVVLVFDADAGGATGVDRALEIFVGQDVDLAVATLPEGLDPCDLLVRQGPEPFQKAVGEAVDALDFKLNRLLAAPGADGVEGRRRTVEAVLGVIALAPDLPGQAGAVKQQLVVSRISQRLALREETVWQRLHELRARRRPAGPAAEEPVERKAPAPPRERQLLQVLLADPLLVPVAAAEIAPAEVEHPGLRKLLEGLYKLHARGTPPDLDGLRPLIDSPALAQTALEFQEIGRMHPERESWLRGLLAEFRKRRTQAATQELQNQLHAASDHTEAVELLRRLQVRTASSEPAPSGGDPGLASEGGMGWI
jgi:DNA primase